MTAPDTASQWERGAQDTGSVENGGIALASIHRVICSVLSMGSTHLAGLRASVTSGMAVIQHEFRAEK